MNIIIPINVAALRVSPSTSQTAKTALYDFSAIGQSPISATGNLVAAQQFLNAEELLGREAGIHLHWSLPEAYAQGQQSNSDGSVNFPGLPNRWLVTRYFKNANDSSTNIKIWILEADAHASDQASVNNSTTTMPWMDSASDLYGMQFHYAGCCIPLLNTWTEPGNTPPPGAAYLGSLLQAPMAYGETFTAYYQHCQNLFGFYDDFSDLFSPSSQLENNCEFSVSYSVVGWVTPQSNDTVIAVLNQAVTAYNNMQPADQPAFVDYIQQVFEGQLSWSLDNYTGFTPSNAMQAQGILSGVISGIQWNIVNARTSTYPSPVPDASGVSVSIGNSNAEALSAYLNALESGSSSQDPGSITSNLEWLLNALQFGQLPNLGAGELGVGQLDQYLHARSFGSSEGGYIWSVRDIMTPGKKATPKEPVEATLSLPLAILLSRLNDAQQQYDALNNEIGTRRQKLFFDWSYHVNALQVNAVPNSQNFNQDVSGAYLLDGLMHLFPCMVQAGASGAIAGTDGPYTYAPAPFQIAAPVSQIPSLPNFTFNLTANTNAGTAGAQLLALFETYAGTISADLGSLGDILLQALNDATAALAGGSTASSYIDQAVAAVQSAQSLAQSLSAAFNSGGQQGGISNIKSAIDADLTSFGSLTNPTTGTFAQYLAVTSSQSVPLPPGQVYTGTMSSFAAFGNAASWGANGTFNGISDVLNQLTGQGSYPAHLFDTQVAAVYIATAFFWRNSGDTANNTTPYYLQLGLQEINSAQTDAQNASSALQTALATLFTSTSLLSLGQSLAAIATTSIPAILTSLTQSTPDLNGALTQIQALIADDSTSTTVPLSIPALIALTLSSDYDTFAQAIDSAATLVVNRLPLAQRVSILSIYLNSQIDSKYQLGRVPARAFWQPAEPVLLLSETTGQSDLIQPVNRNGTASLLPCRLDSETIQTSSSVQFPSQVSGLATSVNPDITGLSTVLQQIVEEGYLLCPEMETLVTASVLQTAAIQNQTLHFDQFNRVELQAPPAGLTGLLPYTIAWNWWNGADPFLPLFIFWQAGYLYSQQFTFATESLPASYLSSYAMDNYLVGYQPTAGSINNFQVNNSSPNYFNLSGVATLTSSSTANLSNQIRNYCTNTFNYDPSTGPPQSSDPNHDEEQLFYETYNSYLTLNVLSQSLGGFNAGLVQRFQDLQLPVNIPDSWISSTGYNLPETYFWPTQFLFNQSATWPSNWSSQSIDFDAFATGNSAIYFNPLRAGFAQIQGIKLVDVFGRFVSLPSPNPTAVAESLRSQVASPVSGYPIYLPPRLVQPSRVLGQWISAAAPVGLADFTEWNPHPAASPICGWLLPNHLDGSLVVYNAGGAMLGSLQQAAGQMRWFTVPGEEYSPATDNRTLMLNDLTAGQANPELQLFLEDFVYASEAASSAENFQLFLNVLDQAQQFIITKSMQEDQSLVVLIGQPLVLARASIQLQLKGVPDVSLDSKTYMPWNGASAQFELDSNGFVPYNFANFNDGGISNLEAPIRIGAVDYQKNGQITPYFDDGLVGFFLNEDYSTFYTPVNVPSQYQIVTTAGSATSVAQLLPGGAPITVTLLFDPRASVHLTSGLLPVEKLRLPQDQYAAALDRILVTFLTAPILQSGSSFPLPVPAEPGYAWSWWRVGLPADQSLANSQPSADANFSSTTPTIVDGWLKLKRSVS